MHLTKKLVDDADNDTNNDNSVNNEGEKQSSENRGEWCNFSE